MSINHLAYNTKLTHITCCTDTGFIIYSLVPNLEKKSITEIPGGLYMMKLLDNTNLSLNIESTKPKNKINLWDAHKKQILQEINLKESVKNIFILKQRIISVLEKNIIILDWNGNQISNLEIYSNEKGLCAISSSVPDNIIIATLGTKKGEIAIYKQNILYKTIQAHITNIECLSINTDATYIVTASEIGTIIRIFNIETGEMEYEFRRGSYSAKIYDLCFNNSTSLLACYSSNGTIHMFDLYSDLESTKNTGSVLSGFKNYLPNYFSSQWAFKQIHTDNNIRAICAFDPEDNLHITLYSGKYYKIKGLNNNFNIISEGSLFVTEN